MMSMTFRLTELEKMSSLNILRIYSSVPFRFSNSLDPLAMMLELPQHVWLALVSRPAIIPMRLLLAYWVALMNVLVGTSSALREK